MKYVFSTVFLFMVLQSQSQIINPGFEEWDTVSLGGQPYIDLVGWTTNNDHHWSGGANTPVTREAGDSGFYVHIESNYIGIDATLSGEIYQKIPTNHLSKITFLNQCDSIYNSGRCVVRILADDPFNPLYADSISVVADTFSLYSIDIPLQWTDEYDSLTIQFVAKGNMDSWDKYEDGYSIFLVDNVNAEYMTPIHELLPDDMLTLYPNPSTGIIQLQHEPSFAPLDIEVYSLLGHRVLKEKYSPVLDLGSLPAGPYVMHVKNDKERIYKMILLTK